VTPATRPPRTSIEPTWASVRIAAPAARALAAIDSEIAPIPPRTWPHDPATPSSPPSQWWSRLYAVPGVRGPAHTPTTPVVASAPLIASELNHSSSSSPTGIVITRYSSCTSRRRRPAMRAASRSIPSRSPGRREPGCGGGRSSIGRMKRARRSNISAKPG
jgi:hypothetical protein